MTDKPGPQLAPRGQQFLHDFGPGTQWPVPGASIYDPVTNPDGLITSLSVAENSLLSEDMVDYMNKHFHITIQHLKYRPSLFNSDLPNMTTSIAKFLNKSLNPVVEITTRQALVSPGVGAIFSHLLWHICSPGDGVLLTCPFYADYSKNITWPSGAQLIPVVAPHEVDSLSLDIIPYMRETILDKNNAITVIILNNPHNPLGKAYSPEMIIEYAKLAEEFNLHLIADEVFANEVFSSKFAPNPTPFRSILSFSSEDLQCNPARIYVVAGPTKDLGASGVKLGSLVCQSNPEALQVVGSGLSVTPLSSASDALFSHIIEDEAFLEDFLDRNRQALGRAFELLGAWCEGHGFPFLKSEAGVFALVDFARLADMIEGEMTIVERMAEVIGKIRKQGVVLRSSTASHDPIPTRIRIVFTSPAPIMKVAFARIERAFDLPQVDLT